MATKKTAEKKKKKKKRATRRKKRGRYRTYKDVQVAFLDDMAAGDEAMTGVRNLNARPTTIRRAVKMFKENGQGLRYDVDKLLELAPKPSHGRQAPKDGEDRDYKAQRIGKGACFLRLPLDVLGVKKGTKVSVSFTKDKIEIRRKTKPEAIKPQAV